MTTPARTHRRATTPEEWQAQKAIQAAALADGGLAPSAEMSTSGLVLVAAEEEDKDKPLSLPTAKDAGPEGQDPQQDPEEETEDIAKSLIFEVAILKLGKDQTVTGIVLEPETVDAQGDIYDKGVIRRACHKYLGKYNKKTTLGFMHKDMKPDFDLCECWIAPCSLVINGTTVKEGTWLMTVKVNDAAKWKDVEAGKISGFSIGGVAKVQKLPLAAVKKQKSDLVGAANTAVRRFIDLDVDEVSLVDRAANERVFLVCKRLEDTSVPPPESPMKTAAPTAPTLGAIVEALPQGGTAPVAKAADPAATTTEEVEKAAKKKKKEDMAAAMKAAGMTDDEVAKALAAIEVVTPVAPVVPAPVAAVVAAPVAKAADPAPTLSLVEQLAGELSGVAKGHKQFTPERKQKFTAALQTLIEVAKDLEDSKPDAAPAQLPAGTQLTGSGISTQKMLEDAMSAALAPVIETQKSINARLDGVEGKVANVQTTHAAPTSAQDGQTEKPGAAPGTPTTKAKKSIFAGVV